VRLRGCGNFSFKITDAVTFFKELSGTNAIYTTDEISVYLKNLIISHFTDVLGELKLSALEIPSKYQLIADLTKSKLKEKLAQYGVSFSMISIQSISLPEEVEKYIDKRSSIGAIGDLDIYTKFQTAEAIKDIANNPGGIAGIGAGLGAGIIFGKVFGENALVSEQERNNKSKSKFCNNCGKELGLETKFCDECGEKQDVFII
jgi:membrane protease subunit (stomatin/prohibitin family)